LQLLAAEFSGLICSYLPGLSWHQKAGIFRPYLLFLAGIFRAAGKLFWYLQRDFLFLIQKFSGGKLKQKGFFHSVL
jgi:hypothetical protein